MERTEWYPMSIKPVREGWYEVGYAVGPFKIEAGLFHNRHVIQYMAPYHYWDGVCFRGPSSAPTGKALTVASYLDEYDYWRGVKK